MNLDSLKKYAIPAVRISMALVFLWFGISQVTDQSMWTGYIPQRMGMMAGPEMIVSLNGIVEIILGILLLIGVFTRPAALILGLHLLGITLTVGYNSIGVRDFGLAIATLAVFMNGDDELCLAKKPRKK